MKNTKIKKIAAALYNVSAKKEYQSELIKFLKLLYKSLKGSSVKYPLKINIPYDFLDEISGNYRSEIKTITKFLFEEYKFLKIPKNLNLLINKLEEINIKNMEIERVCIETAYYLDTNEKSKIENRLKNVLNRNIICKFKVDPELIGGIKILMRDKLLDFSIKSRIERIKRIILEESAQ